MTPVIKLTNLGREIGLKQLYMKDEGQLPTGTFKARGAAVGVSKAKELGLRKLAMPSNGNAGAAWAATMGLELAEQFDWEIPDVIICPTGGGVGIIGIYKAIKELQEIGWISKKMRN